MPTDDGWTFVADCECERCTDHHAATCEAFKAALRDDPWGEKGLDCGCIEASGAIEAHAKWAHPNCPIREDV